MADLVSVPDSGAGSGSSTATFGEGLGQIFAMPVSGQVDTSAAESDSGVDVCDSGMDGDPPQLKGVRRMAPEDDSWIGPRSPARVPPRHGTSAIPSSRSPSSRRPPPQSSTGSVPGGLRGRPEARSPSDSASGSSGRQPIGVISAAALGGVSPTVMQSPSIAPTLIEASPIDGGSGYSPTRVDTPFTPTHIDTPASSPGALPTPNGMAEKHQVSMPSQAPFLQRSQRTEPPSLAPTQYYPSPTSPIGVRREHMDDSQAAKRANEHSSLPHRSVTRARTVSPLTRVPEPRTSTRVPEPLSYLPEHASPSSGSVVIPIVRQVEIFRPVTLPRVENPPEPRLHVSMTLTEYEGMVASLQVRFQQAQALGQEQGVQAMNDVVTQLILLVEQMYQEGRTLQQQYDQLEATLASERQVVTQWLARTKQELQKEAQEFVESHRQSLHKQFEEEKSKMTKALEQDREDARIEYLRQTSSQSQAAARSLEEAKRALAEDFRQQKADIKAQMEIQSQQFIDDYKRTVDTTAQLQSSSGRAEAHAALKEHQVNCEREFQLKAREFKTQVESEHLKEMSQLNSTIQALKSDNALLQNRVANPVSSFDEEQMKQTLMELREEKERYREAYNRTVQDLNRLRKDCERQAEQVKTTPPSLSPSDRQKAQEDSRWSLNLFAGRTPLYDTPPAPVMSQTSLAPSLPLKTSETLPAGWGSSPNFGASPVQHPYGTGYGNGYRASALVQHSWQQQGSPPATDSDSWQQHVPRGQPAQNQQSQQRDDQPQWEQRQPHQHDRSNQGKSADQQSYIEVEEEEEEEEEQEEEYDGKVPKHLIRKESEKIVLPPFPDVVSFRAWKTQVVHAVVHASARPDTQIVIAWIHKSFEKGISMEDLQNTPKHFISLDGKVASAVQYILNQAGTKGKTLLSKITMKMQDLLESKQILLTGRQAVFMVAQNFKTANDTETYLGIEHLANLIILNNDLEQFWMRWEQMLGQLPPDSIQNRGLETMLYGKIRKHPEMATAIKEYERAAPNSALKSYDWLAVEVRRTCSLDMMHRNFQDRDDRMR